MYFVGVIYVFLPLSFSLTIKLFPQLQKCHPQVGSIKPVPLVGLPFQLFAYFMEQPLVFILHPLCYILVQIFQWLQ